MGIEIIRSEELKALTELSIPSRTCFVSLKLCRLLNLGGHLSCRSRGLARNVHSEGSDSWEWVSFYLEGGSLLPVEKGFGSLFMDWHSTPSRTLGF